MSSLSGVRASTHHDMWQLTHLLTVFVLHVLVSSYMYLFILFVFVVPYVYLLYYVCIAVLTLDDGLLA